MDAVHLVVRTLKETRGRRCRVNKPPFDRIESRLAGEACRLNIAKTMIREPRLVRFGIAAVENVVVFSASRAGCRPVERTVRLGRFRKPQFNGRAARSLYAETDPTAEIAPHIVDVHAGFGLSNCDRPHNLAYSPRLQHGGGKFAAGRPRPNWLAPIDCASNPGISQPACSRRASKSSPS